MTFVSTAELEALEALYARQPRDAYLPPAVAQRASQIRELIAEIKIYRESAGDEEANLG